MPKALFIRSVKNFVRRAYFCLYKLNFDRKKFSTKIKKFFYVHQKKKQKSLAYEIFTLK